MEIHSNNLWAFFSAQVEALSRTLAGEQHWRQCDRTHCDQSSVMDASPKVKCGEGAYERDLVVFDQIEHVWPILAGPMWAAVGDQCSQNLAHPAQRWRVVSRYARHEGQARLREGVSLKFEGLLLEVC